MTEILIKPLQLQETAGRLQVQAGQINAALQNVDRALAALGPETFAGLSADELRRRYLARRDPILAAPHTLDNLATLLNQAACLFGQADDGGGEGECGVELEDGVPFVQGVGDGIAVHPNDVRQGYVGDCYLMASLAAIAAQRPDLLAKMITATNADGSYTVTLYQREKWLGLIGLGQLKPVEIRVEKDFFYRQNDCLLLSARPGDHAADGRAELWPALIEKAYAQLNGGYTNINGGWAASALETLTGQPSRTALAATTSIEELDVYHRQGWALIAATHGDFAWKEKGTGKAIIDWPDLTMGNPLFANKLLLPNHAYYITGVDVPANTITLRNPHGWANGAIVLPYDQFQRAFIKIDSNPLGNQP